MNSKKCSTEITRDLTKFPNKLNLQDLLNKIAPVKVNVLHFNNNVFMSKSLRKAIMLRPRQIISTNKGLMKTETIISSKGIFVLSYYARSKKNILVILMSKLFQNHKTILFQ